MDQKIFCEFCGKKIPKERLAILPDTTTCVKCSQIKPYSENEILGVNSVDEQERNRLNYEDFDENGSETHVSFSDMW
jgi:hypothetical protein